MPSPRRRSSPSPRLGNPFRPLHLEALEVRATPATLMVTSLDDVTNRLDDQNALTLREAILTANQDTAPDTIVFDPLLTLGGPGKITLSEGRLRINTSITIEGPKLVPVTISGDDLYQGFFIDGRTNGAVTVNISDLYVFNGLANGLFGTTINGVDNGLRGAGLYNDLGTVNLTRMFFYANEADFGSAIYNFGGAMTIRDSTVFRNLSNFEGAVVNQAGTLNVIQSTIGENQANGAVGGLQNLSGTLNVIQSSVILNVAINNFRNTNFGGGIQSNPGTTTRLVNSIFYNNWSVVYGTFPYIIPSFQNPDFFDSDIGGSVDTANSHHNLVSSLTAGGLLDSVKNNIVDENIVFSFHDVYTDMFGRDKVVFEFAFFDTAGRLDGTTIDGTFIFTPLDFNGGLIPTYLPGQFFTVDPNIDLGDNQVAVDYGLTFDQRGLTRVRGGTIDIGAVETGNYATTTTLVASPVPSRFGAVTTFTATMSAANGVPTGTVTFRVDGAVVNTATLDSTGVAVFSTTGLAVGMHTVRATYSGDNLYNSSFNTINIVVTPPKLEVDTLSDVSDGNWNPGRLSLREAILLANLVPTDNDIITFATALTQFGPAQINVGSTLPITGPVEIRGPGVEDLLIVGNNTFSLFNVTGTSPATAIVKLSDMSLIGGGGATNGGAISNTLARVDLTDVYIYNHASANGGSIYNAAGSQLNLTRTLVGNSTATAAGGGIRNVGGATAVIDDSLLLYNLATGDGGAISNDGALTVRNTYFFGNQGASGGGVFNGATGVFTSVNNSFLNGTATADGGAIFTATGGVTKLYNTLFVDNQGQSGQEDVKGANVDLESAHNLFADVAGTGGLTHGLNGNILGKDNGSGGRIDLAPDEVIETTSADNGGWYVTLALTTDSPAIDAGSTINATLDGAIGSVSLTHDNRGTGFARVTGAAVDIGAYELQHLIVDQTQDEDDTDYTSGDLSLREAVRLANVEKGPAIISFAAGLPAVQLDLGSLVIDNGGVLTRITGPDDGTQTIARHDFVTVPDFPVFELTSTALADFHRLTIQGGVNDTGGGIESAGTLNVSDSVITGNRATIGGGGIYSTGTLTLTGSVIAENHSDVSGGGLRLLGPTSIDATTIARNSGGAIHASADLTIFASSIWENTTNGNGGALLIDGGTTGLNNSTVSDNRANSSGGGAYLAAGTLFIRNATIVKNRADADNNGIGQTGGVAINLAGTNTLEIGNSIIAGNTAVNGTAADLTAGSVDFASHNLIGDPATAGGILHGALGNILGKDNGSGTRILLPLDEILRTTLKPNGGTLLTHALLPTSPAIDAGDNTLVAGDGFDQRRDPFGRIADGPDADATAIVDLGAYEFGGGFQKEDVNQDGLTDIGDVLAMIFFYNQYALPAGGSIATSALPAGLGQRCDVTADGTFDLGDFLQAIFAFNVELGGNTEVPKTPTVDKLSAPLPSGESAAGAGDQSEAPGSQFVQPPASAAASRLPLDAPVPAELPDAPAEWDAALLLALLSLGDGDND